jgi:hypothetical protein
LDWLFSLYKRKVPLLVRVGVLSNKTREDIQSSI